VIRGYAQAQVMDSATIERALAVLSKKVEYLEAQVDRLREAKSDDREWMGINEAIEHPSLKGKMTARQLSYRITKSLEDPISSPFIVNVHFQVIHGNTDRKRYTVNVAAIAQLIARN
jgi:hypothetical protein